MGCNLGTARQGAGYSRIMKDKQLRILFNKLLDELGYKHYNEGHQHLLPDKITNYSENLGFGWESVNDKIDKILERFKVLEEYLGIEYQEEIPKKKYAKKQKVALILIKINGKKNIV